jgi:tetratricopeptide (TPR) repeat protein
LFVLASRILVVLCLVMQLHSVAQAQAASELRMKRISFFNRFEQGRNYFSSGQYLESSAYFRSLLKEMNELPPLVVLQVKYYYGASLDELGVRATARQFLDEVFGSSLSVVLWADSARRLIRLARETGDFESARRYWLPAQRRIPTAALKDPVAWEAALSFDAMGDANGSQKILSEFGRRSKYWGPAQYMMGSLMQELDRIPAAIDVFSELSEAEQELMFWDKPELISMAELALARLYYDQGQFRRALAQYREIDPEFSERPQILFEQAWCYAAMEQYDQAIRALTDLIVNEPDSVQAGQAVLLAGYFKMQEKRFGEAYAAFETAQTAYMAVAGKIQEFIRSVPGKKLLGQTVLSPAFTQTKFPGQIEKWIQENESVEMMRPIEVEIKEVERALSGIQSDIQEVQILTAAYGSSYLNPLTLELKIRDNVARQLADIQRRLLEHMARPYRDAMRYAEYAVFNRTEQVLDELLRLIDEQANEIRADAVDKQKSLRSVGNYMRLVSPEDFGYPAEPEGAIIDYEAYFDQQKPLKIYRETLLQRRGLSDILLKTAIDVDGLWTMVVTLVEQQRSVLVHALKRMGAWGKTEDLIILDRLYNKSLGLQKLVTELTELLYKVRLKVLDDVMESTQAQADYITQLEELNDLYTDMLNEQRYMAFADAIRRVGFEVRETGVGAVIGKLDLSWRLHKNEEKLYSGVLSAELERTGDLAKIYKDVKDHLQNPPEAGKMQLSKTVLDQLGQDEESLEVREMIDDISEIDTQLGSAEYVKNRLKSGSSSVLHQPGQIRW